MTIFENLIGHRINGVFLANEDWTLIFRTCEGKYFRYDTDNDCCNSVWVNHISGINCLGNSTNSFDLLQGALVTCAEDKGWGENRDDADYDVVQDGFWTISTDKGYIDIEVRNSHNGYYGGQFDEAYSPEKLHPDEFEDSRQITEDF